MVERSPGTLVEGTIPESSFGGPEFRATLRLLMLPALLAAMVVLGVPLSGGALYAFALIACVPVLLALPRNPEPLLALFVLYLPLCKSYAIPIAPGINGTNMFEAGLLLALMFSRSRGREAPIVDKPLQWPVALWAFLSLLSFVTTMERVGVGEVVIGYAYLLKAWLDQFIVFFVVGALISDRSMARRVIIYLMIGTILVMFIGFQEWLDSRFLDSIEKSRLLGPQLQPNDFGAYLTYSAGPFIGLFLVNWTRWRSWFLLAYFIVLARLTLATFSRGAYIGLGAALLAATYVRSKLLLIFAIGLVFGLINFEPALMPESMKARVGQTTGEAESAEELDKSSGTRIVLWDAAIAMTLERPILGHGFASFPMMKGKYTEIPVEESDNHNMFLYICSQMGIPALAVFLFLIWRTYVCGARLFRSSANTFDKSIGLGAVAIAGGIIGVNMFGSRMVDIAVSGYYWVYLAALAALLGKNNASSHTPGRPS
ncbi:MAG: O-antigen ligase family protein [Rhodocyclales bacterium]|nr:O-antigen ligase family protein [Rhodocyclales bacterium]